MDRQKGYLIKHSYDNDFVNKMEELYKNYGEEIFSIQGIANKHLDIVHFSDSFFGTKGSVAEIGIDPNANVREHSISFYNNECNKAMKKINSLHLLHHWVKKTFNKEDADKALEKIINGELFVNDLTGFLTTDIVLRSIYVLCSWMVLISLTVI